MKNKSNQHLPADEEEQGKTGGADEEKQGKTEERQTETEDRGEF